MVKLVSAFSRSSKMRRRTCVSGNPNEFVSVFIYCLQVFRVRANAFCVYRANDITEGVILLRDGNYHRIGDA